MARSRWKFNYINSFFFKKMFLVKFKLIKIPKIYNRASIVPKIFLKKTVSLYKGNIFSKIFFSKYCLGYKIGEFAFTRKPFNFPLKKKKR